MKTALCLAVVSLAVGGPAFAAERASSECVTLKAMKTKAGAKFTPLNIGQFNYALGAFDATTPAHTPLPAADNAISVQFKGKPGALIVWMKGECASVTPPMPMGPEFSAHILAIHPVAGETSDAEDDSKDLHL